MTELQPAQQPDHTIDLTESLNAIRRTYGERYFAIPEAQWKAAALWGVTPETHSINDCGVFTSLDDRITLRHGECRITITLVQAPNGYWTMSTGYMTRFGGSTYAPSIWCTQAFPSRYEARLMALWELTGNLQQIAESKCSTNTELNRREIRQMIALIEAEKTPQLSLF